MTDIDAMTMTVWMLNNATTREAISNTTTITQAAAKQTITVIMIMIMIMTLTSTMAGRITTVTSFYPANHPPWGVTVIVTVTAHC